MTTQEPRKEVDEALLRKVELAISVVLRVGVVVSVGLVLAGLGLTFAQHASYSSLTKGVSYHHLTNHSTPFPHDLGALFHDVALGNGRGIIGLGLIVLIATPVLRVAVGVLSFIFEKDPRMAAITFFVLVVLLGSFVLGSL